MKIKTLARLHIISIFMIGMMMGDDTPIITGYISWSILLWLIGYPIYYMLWEPGWD